MKVYVNLEIPKTATLIDRCLYIYFPYHTFTLIDYFLK